MICIVGCVPPDTVVPATIVILMISCRSGNCSRYLENARLYGIQRRITEQLRLSEGKYRRLFELASDAIFVTDLNVN